MPIGWKSVFSKLTAVEYGRFSLSEKLLNRNEGGGYRASMDLLLAEER